MKKIILSAIMMMATAGAFAQHAVGSFTLQPRIGVNIANVTDFDEADPRIGLAAGAELEYQVADWLSLAGGAMYSMQGFKVDVFGSDATAKLDYLNIPIVANFYILKGLALKAGIQPGFKLSAKASSNDKDIELLDDEVKGFDLSIPVGLSYEYKNLVLDGRWNVGATKISEEIDGIKPQNTVFQITLGYKFGL